MKKEVRYPVWTAFKLHNAMHGASFLFKSVHHSVTQLHGYSSLVVVCTSTDACEENDSYGMVLLLKEGWETVVQVDGREGPVSAGQGVHPKVTRK